MKLKDFINFVRNTGYMGNLNLFSKTGHKIPSDMIDCVMEKDVVRFDCIMKKDVVKFEKNNGVCDIYIDISVAEIYDEDTKFYWKVCQFAEGCTDGYVLLTKKEAEIVSYATSQDNWKHLKDEPWCGCFIIDLDNPIREEDFENGRV